MINDNYVTCTDTHTLIHGQTADIDQRRRIVITFLIDKKKINQNWLLNKTEYSFFSCACVCFFDFRHYFLSITNLQKKITSSSSSSVHHFDLLNTNIKGKCVWWWGVEFFLDDYMVIMIMIPKKNGDKKQFTTTITTAVTTTTTSALR